jgi:TFIIF-interacting CTD phosphatase-like protein
MPLSSSSSSAAASAGRGPYSRQAASAKPTLVLDMDETLIHTVFNPSGSHTVLHRPGLFDFLDAVRPHYGRIIIFTASTADYADAVLDSLDPHGKYFDARLYRESCTILKRGPQQQGAVYAKDLTKVVGSGLAGLERCVIVDNIADNFCLQPAHGIAIKDFTGDSNDRALVTLAPLLVRFADNPEQQASQFFPRAMPSVSYAVC